MSQDSLFQIAFCILCHKYTPVLAELVRQLDVPGNELFIHVDGKSRIEDFAPLRNRANIHFIEPRTKVYWGGIGMIESTLRLFTATRDTNCQYIVLISGDTLPLRPVEEIRATLQSAYGKNQEFISIDPVMTDAIRERVSKRRFYPDKATIMRRIKRCMMRCCLSSENPYFDKLPPLKKGSQWIAITNHFRDCIFNYLTTHPDFIRAFQYSHAADELFFQTLICDTPFAARNTCSSLVLTDWSRDEPHPKMFGTDDLPLLAAFGASHDPDTGPLFVRKVDDRLDIARYREIVLGEAPGNTTHTTGKNCC